MLTSTISNYQVLPISKQSNIFKTISWRTIKFLIVLLLVLSIFPGNNLWIPNLSFENVTIPIVHYDKTVIKAPERQVKPKIVLVYKNKEGQTIRALAHQEKYSEFIRLQVEKLEIAHQRICEAAQLQFTDGVNAIFETVSSRIPQLADWYYSYGTQYQLLWESIKYSIHYFGDDNIRELISSDLEKIILKHYEYEILKPELTQPKLEQLFSEVLNSVHQSYLKLIAEFEDDFQIFIAEHTTYLDSSLPHNIPEVTLDWGTHIYKVRVAPDAHLALAGIRSLTFALLGGITGKYIELKFANHLVISCANRATIMMTSGSIGAASSGPLAPLGAAAGMLVGGAVGVTVDWMMLQGTELLSRPQFEMEILESVNVTKESIKNKLLSALLDTVDVQHQDLIQLLVKF